MEHRFWIVIRDAPTLTATVRHSSREEAREEANRLAAKHPGARFYVAAVTGVASTVPMPSVQWSELKTPPLYDNE